MAKKDRSDYWMNMNYDNIEKGIGAVPYGVIGDGEYEVFTFSENGKIVGIYIDYSSN